MLVQLIGEHRVRERDLSVGNELVRSHPVRHDRTREHGALAHPAADPRINVA